MRPALLPVLGSLLLVTAGTAGCDPAGSKRSANASPPPSSSASAGEKAPSGPGFGEVMVNVGHRFEVTGRAMVAGRYELAEFEVGELEEAFEDDVPHAELPKEGPTVQIHPMAETFLKTNVPELKRAAASKNFATFQTAFEHTAAACNACHIAAQKGFIQVPTVAGRAVPEIEMIPPAAAPPASASARPTDRK